MIPSSSLSLPLSITPSSPPLLKPLPLHISSHPLSPSLFPSSSSSHILDLSSHSTPRHISVIHGPLHAAPAPRQSEVPRSLHSSTPSSSSLPTCSNPIPSSTWLALRLSSPSSSSLPPPSLDSLPTCTSKSSSSSIPSCPRMSYPREFKLVVVDYFHANGRNKYRTCKQFHITKSMLNGWLDKIDKIRESRPGSLKSGRSGRKPQFPDIERQLFTMYQEEANKGLNPSNRWFRDRARSLSRESPSTSSSSSSSSCQFSERWLANFKKRYGIGGKELLTKNREEKKEVITYEETTKSEENEGGSTERDGMIEEGGKGREGTTVQSKQSSDIAEDLLSTHDQTPIHSFYQRFPNLCKRRTTTHQSNTQHNKMSESIPSTRLTTHSILDLEEQLHENLLQRLKDREEVSNCWIETEAERLINSLQLQSKREHFSHNWIDDFKRRYDVHTSQMNAHPPSEPFADPSPFSLPLSFSIPTSLQPDLIFTNPIPFGGIPSARSSSGPTPIIPSSTLQWFLLQQQSNPPTSSSLWTQYM